MRLSFVSISIFRWALFKFAEAGRAFPEKLLDPPILENGAGNLKREALPVLCFPLHTDSIQLFSRLIGVPIASPDFAVERQFVSPSFRVGRIPSVSVFSATHGDGEFRRQQPVLSRFFFQPFPVVRMGNRNQRARPLVAAESSQVYYAILGAYVVSQLGRHIHGRSFRQERHDP